MKPITIYAILERVYFVHPITERTHFLRMQADGSVAFDLFRSIDGFIEMEVHENGQLEEIIEFGPVRFVGAGFLACCITAGESPTELLFFNQSVPRRTNGENQDLVITLPPAPIFDEISIGHPDANEACLKWTEWRRHRYGTPSQPRAGIQRVKSLDEQLDELTGAIAGLGDLVELVRLGRLYMIDHVASSLRALICWDSGQKLQPLLLRMAARSNPPAPLPVFALDMTKRRLDRG